MEILNLHHEPAVVEALEKIIRERRTIHQFSDKGVPKAVVERALELSLWAPNHHVTNPWQYVVIGKSSRQVISKLAVEFKSRKASLSETQAQAITTPYLTVPVLVAVGCKRSEKPQQAREDYASVAAGLQNAALYLWSLGIGTKWTSGEVTRAEGTYQVLKVNPAETELVGFLWIGYPTRVPPALKRVALNEILREG